MARWTLPRKSAPVNGYSLALFIHLLFVLVACSAASLTTFAALRLREAHDGPEAIRWLAFIQKTVPAFPVSVAGLLGTGAFMTHQRWSWSIPWIDTALVGLGLIVVLGSGIEASRARSLGRELATEGLSPRARRLLRDPLAWTAKMTTLTLVVAVVFVMAVKPNAPECVASIVIALATGVLAAVPTYRVPRVRASEAVGGVTS
jgi:hypothetical protein